VFVVFIGGALAARIGGYMARQWLMTNAGWQESFGDRALRYFFGIFTDIGPVQKYAELRRARDQPTTVATVFWVGFAATMVGIVALIGVLATVAS
jgi:hypothetical protein